MRNGRNRQPLSMLIPCYPREWQGELSLGLGMEMPKNIALILRSFRSNPKIPPMESIKDLSI